jgi:uncharacterized damage-inducible protein DinB
MTTSGRPQPGEYADYAQADFDFVEGDDAIVVLRDAERATLAVLEPLDESRVRGLTYAAGKWTLKQVVGHLVDDEQIFAYRALCVARGDTRPLPGFDENEYMAGTDFESRPYAELLRAYRVQRAATIALLEPLTREEWLRRGNVNGYDASVRGLAFHIAAHELHHLRVVRERYLTLGERA